MWQNKKDRLFGYLALAAGMILLLAVLAITVSAAKDTAEQYHQLLEADLSRPLTEMISYSDHLYAELGFGFSTDPEDPVTPGEYKAFLADSLARIDQRILSCGIIYTMVICSVFAYPVFLSNKNDLRKHLLAVALVTAVVFTLISVAAVVSFSASGVPFYYPDMFRLMLICAGVVSAIAGHFTVALLLRAVRLKKLTAVAVVPLTVLLFMFGAVLQGGLYSPEMQDSFDYVYELDERLLDPDFTDAYYDEEKNVLVVEDMEYPPRQVENGDHYRGIVRIGAYVYDILDPFSGCTLSMVQEIIEERMPVKVVVLHYIYAALWLALPMLIKRKQKAAQQE